MSRIEFVGVKAIDGSEVPKAIINAYNDDMVQITIVEMYQDKHQKIIPFDEVLLAKAIMTCRNYIDKASNYDLSQLADMVGFGFLEEGADDPSLLLYEASLNVINRAYPVIGNGKYQIIIEYVE